MFTVRFESAEQRRALQLAKHDLNTEIPKLMEILGIGVLSEAQLAYVDKARGGTGSDGISWAPLKRSTLAARAGKRGKGRTIIAKRKDLAKEIDQLERSKVPSRGRRAPATREARLAARRQNKAIDKKIERLRERRRKLREDFQRLVDSFVANHEIGVDTGLQRASAMPGFRASDGKGGNKLEVRENQVTAGFARSYSTAFDEKRTLMPRELPAPWRTNLEQAVENWATGVVRRYFPR